MWPDRVEDLSRERENEPVFELPSFSLAGIGLFQTLDGADLKAVEARCQWRRFGKDRQIIGEEDATTDVFFVVAGELHVTSYSGQGKEVSFRNLGPGSTVGEFSAIDGLPRSANVIAASDCLIASMSAGTFKLLLRDYPQVTGRFAEAMVAQVRRLTERVFEFSTLPVTARIHAELLRMAEVEGATGNRVVIAPAPTHAEIAARISTHREAVTRELNYLGNVGLLQRSRERIEVLDLARLRDLVEDAMS